VHWIHWWLGNYSPSPETLYTAGRKKQAPYTFTFTSTPKFFHWNTQHKSWGSDHILQMSLHATLLCKTNIQFEKKLHQPKAQRNKRPHNREHDWIQYRQDACTTISRLVYVTISITVASSTKCTEILCSAKNLNIHVDILIYEVCIGFDRKFL